MRADEYLKGREKSRVFFVHGDWNCTQFLEMVIAVFQHLLLV